MNEYVFFFIFVPIYKETLRLKRFLLIWIGVCFLLSGVQKVGAVSVSYPKDKDVLSADSLMDKVIFFAPFYERIVDSYKAELYIKGRANIRKKNHIIRFIPSMFRIRKGVKEYMMETYSDLNFTAPIFMTRK